MSRVSENKSAKAMQRLIIPSLEAINPRNWCTKTVEKDVVIHPKLTRHLYVKYNCLVCKQTVIYAHISTPVDHYDPTSFINIPDINHDACHTQLNELRQRYADENDIIVFKTFEEHEKVVNWAKEKGYLK